MFTLCWLNKTFYQNLFPQSVQEYYCVANSSEIDFGTLQLYRACDAFQCLLVNVALYSSASKQKLCDEDKSLTYQYFIPIPWPLLLLFCIFVIIFPVTKVNLDIINRLSRQRMLSRMFSSNQLENNTVQPNQRGYAVNVWMFSNKIVRTGHTIGIHCTLFADLTSFCL